jgi:hypothetical protein
MPAALSRWIAGFKVSGRRCRTAVVLGAVVGLLAASQASAAYWDFSGDLPSGGSRIYVKYTNTLYALQNIRMSWTVGSHCMRFLHIDSGGSWSNQPSCPGDGLTCLPGSYDCYYGFWSYSIYDRDGCWNPPGLATVYVNCRATNPV